MTDSEPEVTLIVHHLGWTVKQPLKARGLIHFNGLGSNFTPEPFMVTFDVKRDQIEGIDFEKNSGSK